MDKTVFQTVLLSEFKLGRMTIETVVNVSTAWREVPPRSEPLFAGSISFGIGKNRLKTRHELEDHRTLITMAWRNSRKEPSATTPGDSKKPMGLPYSWCWSTQALGVVKKLDRWVRHNLTEARQLRWIEVASSLIRRNSTEPFLHRPITCDEKCIQYDNRKRTAHRVNVNEFPYTIPKPDLQCKKTNSRWLRSGGLQLG